MSSAKMTIKFGRQGSSAQAATQRPALHRDHHRLAYVADGGAVLDAVAERPTVRIGGERVEVGARAERTLPRAAQQQAAAAGNF